MPVREPPEDAPDEIIDLLSVIEDEFAHDHCLFFADSAFNGPGTPSTIWMYYPDDNDYYPENSTYLAAITSLVEERYESTYSHVAGMDEHDYPEDAPPEATELSKISPKGV